MFSKTRDEAIRLPAPSNDLTSVPSLPGSLSANAEALKASAGRQFLELDGRVLRFFATAERGAAAKNGDDTRSDGVKRTVGSRSSLLATSFLMSIARRVPVL